MTLTGNLLIGRSAVKGQNGAIRGFDPAANAPLEPDFGGASLADLDRACALAKDAFATFRDSALETRARLLEAIAQNLLDAGETLVARCMAETGLPRGRVEGERGRTVGQLKMFAGVLRDGGYLDVRIDPAQPERTPPRVDLRLRHIPLGPVAVFGASNFPLAFSVAGGDTASALAAGCPVIVKAHSAHPGTSEIAGLAIQKAVAELGLHEGVFSLLFDSGREVAQGLVADPRIKAVGFTGSRGGGEALVRIAQARAEPIPVYAEMSSINPVILLPHALAARGEAIAKAFAGSLTLGAGQFCTNPGLLLAMEGPGLDAFVAAAEAALGGAAASTMLTPGIHQAYVEGVAAFEAHPAVNQLGQGAQGQGLQGRAVLFSTTAQAFLAEKALGREVFGASSLLIRCPDSDALLTVLASLEGQLTAAIHADPDDYDLAGRILPVAEDKAGRVLFNGFGTGVEVGHAMVHGGPYPATSDSRATSVGSLAIMRFVRPVSYQDVPERLLPETLKTGNPLGIPRRVDGKLEP
ncbi:MAG: aldehyde dehydrogenase [Caulobacteraceae bacterium]|nr:aldehyde dehydrogenase [Caulobacteraceae bacterium]